MTSLEIVDMINAERKAAFDNGSTKKSDSVVLEHSDFLKKVRDVLAGGEGKFSSSYKTLQNKEALMYVFPKREATLMAMSYSAAISAAVYDRMTELEQQVVAMPALPNFSNPAEAARAWALV